MDEMAEHATSCSERLRDWYLSVLVPQGRAAAHPLRRLQGNVGEQPAPDDGRAEGICLQIVCRARGLRMLLRGGIEMRSMQPADWDFLVSLCDRSVQIAWSARGSLAHLSRVCSSTYVHVWTATSRATSMSAKLTAPPNLRRSGSPQPTKGTRRRPTGCSRLSIFYPRWAAAL